MPHQTAGLINRTRRALKGAASLESRSLDSAFEKNPEPGNIPSDGNPKKVIAKARAAYSGEDEHRFRRNVNT